MGPARSIIVIVYMCTLIAWSPDAPGQQVRTLVVSPFGSDQQPGTQAAPLRSLQMAQNRVRAWIAAGLTEDVEVVLRAGVYELNATWQLDLQDTPPIGRTITYRAAPDEVAILSGGVRLENWSQD